MLSCAPCQEKMSATSVRHDKLHKISRTTSRPHNIEMPACQKALRPLARCLKTPQTQYHPAKTIRTFSSTPRVNDEAVTEEIISRPALDPKTITSRRDEKKLLKSGVNPIGSRRRRAAVRSSENIPFEQLPFHCFQEARKILQQDREEKLQLIRTERLRISNLEATDAAIINGGERQKSTKLASMRRHLEYLKIQADINDPMIKKRFEDGEGIYCTTPSKEGNI